jgi:hypothetical protein
MNLRRHYDPVRPLLTAAFVVLGGVVMFGCERDDTVAVDRNLPPETFITQGPEASPDPENPTDLFYRARLFWRGEDRDGTIAGFRFAIDDTTDEAAWMWTTRTDSVFRFQAGEVGSMEHLFLIRAVDNLGKQDATPDTIRFEAFTTAGPRVQYVNGACCASNAAGTTCGLASGDTVLVNSVVKFVWTGSDADGEVVAWETVFGQQQAVRHGLTETTRTVGPLTSGRHDFLVRAIDDAGAVSTSGGLFTLYANFDPVCRIDPTSIRSALDITWLDSDPDVDSVHVTLHDPAGTDTIPYGASVRFCWECEDRDGPIVFHNWIAGFIAGATEDVCVDTDTLCAFDPDSGFVVCRSRVLGPEGRTVSLQVKGRDIYGRVPARAPVVSFELNFAPTVAIDPVPGPIQQGTPVRFTFSGNDFDSDPADLRYRWWFDAEIPPGSFEAFTGQPQTEFRLFAAGIHTLFVQSVDQSGLDRGSDVASQSFAVIP